MRALRSQTIGLLVIAALILVITLLRYGRAIF